MFFGAVMHGLGWLGAENWFHFQAFQKIIQSLERKNKGWEKVKENEGFREEES